MAINPMQAPIDYLGQMGIRPTDPGTALLEGLQLGAVFKQQRQAREQALKAEEFNTAASEFYRNPTLEGARSLQANFPEYAAQFQGMTKDLTAEQRMSEATMGAQVLSAIRAGNTDAAKNMLGKLSQAAREQGDNSGVWDQFAQFVDQDPETAYAYGLATVAAAYPAEMKVIGESWKDLGIGGEDKLVKSTKSLPGGLTINTYRDGTKEVIDIDGNVLTGQAAAKAVSTAENREAEIRRAGATNIDLRQRAYTTRRLESLEESILNGRKNLEAISIAREALPDAITGALSEERIGLARAAALIYPDNKQLQKTLAATGALINSAANLALNSRFLITGEGQGPATEGEQNLLREAVSGNKTFSPAEWTILLKVIERTMAREAEYGLQSLINASQTDQGAADRLKTLTDLGYVTDGKLAFGPSTQPPAAGGAPPPTRERTDAELLEQYGPPRGAQ